MDGDDGKVEDDEEAGGGGGGLEKAGVYSEADCVDSFVASGIGGTLPVPAFFSTAGAATDPRTSNALSNAVLDFSEIVGGALQFSNGSS